MGSYEATMIANQILVFTIPAPCYRFQVTKLDSGTSAVFITGDGSLPVVPVAETVNTGTQVVLAGAIGEQVSVRPWLPGSALGGPPAGGTSPSGTTYPEVLLISSGTPTILVEW
jgi:hypothetical protein